MPRKKAETVSFEEGLKRLETIVEKLEQWLSIKKVWN